MNSVDLLKIAFFLLQNNRTFKIYQYHSFSKEIAFQFGNKKFKKMLFKKLTDFLKIKKNCKFYI